MSQNTINLIEKLHEMEYPNPSDLLQLHQLLQEPENKAQILSTPDQLMMLHQVLVKIADDSATKLATPRTKKNKETGDTKKALDAWIGTESDDEDLDLV